jgi:hypothetical protein
LPGSFVLNDIETAMANPVGVKRTSRPRGAFDDRTISQASQQGQLFPR